MVRKRHREVLGSEKSNRNTSQVRLVKPLRGTRCELLRPERPRPRLEVQPESGPPSPGKEQHPRERPQRAAFRGLSPGGPRAKTDRRRGRGRRGVNGWVGESQPSPQASRLPSAPPKLQAHQGPQPARLPNNLSAFLPAAARPPNQPTKPARVPASPNPAPSAPALLPGLPAAIRPRGASSTPCQPLSRVLSPSYLSRAAARCLPRLLRLPAWRYRGVAANHPLSAPSQGQADQSAAFSGQEAGTENPERKASRPPHTPPAASRSQCAHARGWAR